MKFSLTVFGREDLWQYMTAEEMREHIESGRQWRAELEAAGVEVTGVPLGFTWEGKTVRVRDGKTLVDEGVPPSRLQLGGILVIDCKDMDEAVGWAAKLDNASFDDFENEIHVRPANIDHFLTDEWLELVQPKR